VRLVAVTHGLSWNESAALAVLGDLQTQGNPSGLDAKYTLKNYLAGRLNLDW
jgi:hypothetical protein